ncbi:MAG: serine/threonine-protein kinase [Kiritimatiellia bacterium]
MSGRADKLLHPGGKFGDYTVVRLLGAGGMGAVYLIRGDRSGDEFAVKILDPEVEKSDVEYKRRFLFEAELAMSIRHPNLIAVYDVGRDPDTGFAYIIMEYVPGGTVRDRITKWGALSVEEASDIVYRVAQGLVAVDEHHVVHRDIKPDNIMFTADGVTPKLADLGIARRATGGKQNTVLTQTGYLVGSPAYMAPEQMLDPHRADIRADIHALGISFWEMLAGRRPFETDDTMELVARAMKGEPIPDIRRFRSDVPLALAQLIAKMAHPRVSQRFQTPRQVVDELQDLRARGFVSPRRMRIEKAEDLRRKHQAAVCVGVTAVVIGILLAATAVVSLVKMVRPARPEPRPPLVAAGPEGRIRPQDPPPADREAEETAAAPAPSAEADVAAVSAGMAAADADAPSAGTPPADSPSAVAGKPAPREFAEEWAEELREYAACCAHAAPAGEAARREAIAHVVNEARAIDPDLRFYGLDGQPHLPDRPALTPERRRVFRLGKIFLMLETLRAECPELLAAYAEQKARATAGLARSRTLTPADTVWLLERAVGRELGPFFENQGVAVDVSASFFARSSP